MRVLVTGHKGYIGSVLVPQLLKNKYDVVGLDSDLYPDSQFMPANYDIENIQKDIRDVTKDDLQDIDMIVHLAALSNDPLGDIDVGLTYDINWQATVNLAKWAKACGVRRFVFASSCSVYSHPGDETLSEDSPLAPITTYGRSKVLAEKDLSSMADIHFAPVFLRNATVYGPSPKLRLDLVVNKMVADAYLKKVITVDSNPWRPLVHVEDVCKAIIAVLKAPTNLVYNDTFNVGRVGMNWKVQEIAKAVKKVTGCEIEMQDNPVDKRNYRVDFLKLETRLGLKLDHATLSESIYDLWVDYETYHLSLSDLENGKYNRIAQIKKYMKGLGDDLRWKK